MLPVLLSKVLSAIWPRLGPPGRHKRVGFGGARKRLNLALQGGGAHGAFTWGVLDRLLADGRVAVDGISGASAGAVNAVMLADGLARGGPQEARRRLAEFWRAASFGGGLPAVQRAAIAAAVRLRAAARHADAMARCAVALLVALRSQSAQHQSAEEPDRAICRFRSHPQRCGAGAVHLSHQRPFRRAAGVHTRGGDRRGGDGVGLRAAPVSRGRDRRRALLGRRLQRQSDGAAVSRRYRGPRTC